MKVGYMLQEYMKETARDIEYTLQHLLHESRREHAKLFEAMRYSLLLGGKRIRPILSCMMLTMMKKDYKPFLRSLCAIECVHTYSLIHDDLPAMDDDEYRRGKLTNHKVFGEAMAILAGDALLTEAFHIVSTDTALSAKKKVDIIASLSYAAGAHQMIGGQALDMASENVSISMETLQLLHSGKTGAMIVSAVEIGLILAQASPSMIEAMRRYAASLGLLFQITDDILDEIGTLEVLGKNPGSDEVKHKSTYVSLLGLEGAKRAAEEAAQEARCALQEIEVDTRLPLSLIDYIQSRSN